MKFSNILVRVGLILTVVISLVLSYFIWTNDQRFDTTTSKTTTVKMSEEDISSINNVALPTEIIIADKNNKTYQVHDSMKNLAVEIFHQIDETKMSNLVRVPTTNTRYLKMLHNSNFVQLVYPDSLTIETFAKIFEIKTNDIKKANAFNRIFIPQDDSNNIYLGNDDSESLYRLKAQNLNKTKIAKLIKNTSRKVEVSLEKIGKQYTPFYLTENKANIYSYLVSNQPESFFVSKLLGTNEIESKVNEDQATYTSGLYKRISINRQKNTVSFTNLGDTAHSKQVSALFSRSFSYLLKTGLSMNDLRYFARGDDYISYRNYVEGLPVFYDEPNVPAVQTNFYPSGINLNFYNENLQIPIPPDKRMVTIPKTKAVVENIERRGIKKDDIQRIELGFTLEPDSEVDKLVNLTPTIYLQIYNEWKSYDEWMQADLSGFDMRELEAR